MTKEEKIKYILDAYMDKNINYRHDKDAYENSLTIYYDYDVFDLDNEDTVDELYEEAKQMMNGGE